MAGTLFTLRTRVQLRAALRRKGYSFREINQAVADCTEDVIDAAVEEVGAAAQVAEFTGTGFLDTIIDFFGSPLGKMLIELLMKLLLGGLAATADEPLVAATAKRK